MAAHLNRRNLIAAAGLGLGAAALWPTAPAFAAYRHPGLLHTQTDFDRMAANVNAGAQPWKADWDRLVANSHSRSSWTANPQQTVYRGSGTPENYGILYNDIAAAYQNALRWKVSGSTAYGDTARNILNAWSATLTKIDGTADRFLAAGIYGYQFANVAEIMRGYPGFDLPRFRTMMANVFYPLNNDFLLNHNGAYITNYWANWDLCAVASILAIGILNDDGAKVNQAVDYFYNGAGQGSLSHAIPYVYESEGLAQYQESCRDQGHTTFGIGLLGAICEMAWNQGIDLYGADNNRIMKACEYVAKYNLGYDVPFTTQTIRFGAPGIWSRTDTFTQISSTDRGNIRPIWELVYNHYAIRRGLSVPYIAAYATRVRPEGGGGDYGPNSGGFDQLGFGTLACTRQSGPLPSGIYTFTNQMSGRNLDNGNTTAEGGTVIQWTPNSANPQRWKVVDVGGGYYTLTNRMSGKNLDNANTTAEGATVIQWTPNGGYPQQWRISAASGGYFTLTSRRSGKNLDNGNTTAEGGTVIQWTPNGGNPQRWRPVWAAPA